MRVKVKGTTKGISKPQTKGVLIKAIEDYLSSVKVGEDRGHGWNSPSSVGGCLRSSYFSRTKVPPDFPSNDPRLQRIFDNGTGVHVRLQDYLKGNGILKEDEAPLFNLQHLIMGTTDGLLLIDNTLAVLEIKSINSFAFSSLKDAKPEHKLQASIYMYCLNEMRKSLLRGGRAELESAYLKKLGTFLRDGNLYTKEQKIERQFKAFCRTLDLLELYPKPLTQVVFLYENKDTQELKEFVVEDDGSISKEALQKFDHLNYCVENKVIPSASKTYICNGCRYRKVCKTIE